MTTSLITERPARDVAVIIVTWNVRALALDAIRTVRADLLASQLDVAIWVVDNASADGTPDAIRAEFPDVRLLALPENIGFAAGNNVALRALGFCDTPRSKSGDNGQILPRAVFLLNPDTRTQPGAVRTLYDTLNALPDAGIVGARLEYADGSFQHGAFGFPGLAQLVIDLYPLGWLPRPLFGRLYESRINGRCPRALYDGDHPFAVGHTLGATLFMRREAIQQTGLFDEQFYMYCEEIDWSMRIQAAGWRIYCEPRARVTHLAGQSSQQIRVQSVINLWKSRLRLFKKYDSPRTLRLKRALITLGVRLQVRRAWRLPPEQRDAQITAYRAIEKLATQDSDPL